MSIQTWRQRQPFQYATAAAVLCLAAACSPGPAPADTASAPAALPAATAPTPDGTTSTPKPTPTTVMGQRCGAPDVEAVRSTVAGPDGATLALWSVGSGDTAALLLHQINRSASCGWWPFANRLKDEGVRAALLDFCGWGASRCDKSTPWSADYADQAARAVAQLRQQGARRVTLVGASLGGTVASVAAAQAGADAVVNLSGFGYGPLLTGPALATLTIPVLGVGSHSEQADSATLESQVAASPSPTQRFVWSEAGHGWSLVLAGPQPDSPLSPVGQTVIAWTKGDYAR